MYIQYIKKINRKQLINKLKFYFVDLLISPSVAISHYEPLNAYVCISIIIYHPPAPIDNLLLHAYSMQTSGLYCKSLYIIIYLK